MTSDVTTDLVLLIYLALIGSLIGMPLIVAFRQVRLERRRIMADGTQAPGQVTAIKARTNAQAIVNFSFDPTGAGKPVTGRQRTSMAAVRQRGLMPGSSVTVQNFAVCHNLKSFSIIVINCAGVEINSDASPPYIENPCRSTILSTPALSSRS
jgi:hypothetical protein